MGCEFFATSLCTEVVYFLFFMFCPAAGMEPRLIKGKVFIRNVHFLCRVSGPIGLFPSVRYVTD